ALRPVFAYEKWQKERGALPKIDGNPVRGFHNEQGWRLQGFIEDARGNLRLQTREEHEFCMGCHKSLGVTVDTTFTLARKVPGSAGWRHQNVRGLLDVPQAGHPEPEVLTYFKRVGGGDEFRANDEILERFFTGPGGTLNEAEVRRAAPGGDKDLAWLLAPSRERALAMNKAYWLTVQDQTFHLGREPVLRPTKNVHERIENGSTELKDTGKVYKDGRLWLEW
ncbi:MAG: hypothetical protein ACYS22_13650, partial [Planctomycetota bacterium]